MIRGRPALPPLRPLPACSVVAMFWPLRQESFACPHQPRNCAAIQLVRPCLQSCSKPKRCWPCVLIPLRLSLQRHFSASTKFAHVKSRLCGRKQRGKEAFCTPINPCARRACSRSIVVGLEGSFYEGLSVKCLLALFFFICIMILRYTYTH